MSLLKDKIELEIQEAELAAQKNLAEFPPILRWLVIMGLILTLPAYFVAKTIAYKTQTNELAATKTLAKPSYTDPKNPNVSNVYLTTLGPSQFAAAVLATNPNLDLSAKSVSYKFTFLNSQKQILHEALGKTFFLPNESKYLVVPTFNSPEKITFANFEFTDGLTWQKKLAIPKVEITTSLPKTSFETSPPAFAIEGNFYNNSAYQLKQVHLTFILFDTQGTIIGASYRDEFTVNPFERRSYKQLWPNMNGDNVSRVQVFAETNQLDPGNLKIQNYGTGSSGSLDRPEQDRAR